MMKVIPLSSKVIFKRAFSRPEVFREFAKDVLDITIEIDQVHTEYEYPKPIGFVRSRYDLFAENPQQRIIVEIQHIKEEDSFDRFLYYHLISLVEQINDSNEYHFNRDVYTIIILTSVLRDGSVNFSCAVSKMNPISEHGKTINLYPHRLVFLCPRLVNEATPPKVRKWLDFIQDSLDGKMEESVYPDESFRRILRNIYTENMDPGLLAQLKDEAAWAKAVQRYQEEGREEGEKRKALETTRKMRDKGYSVEEICELTGVSPTELL
jgi:predicted transposase/invertase (TIGR01784 family)